MSYWILNRSSHSYCVCIGGVDSPLLLQMLSSILSLILSFIHSFFLILSFLFHFSLKFLFTSHLGKQVQSTGNFNIMRRMSSVHIQTFFLGNLTCGQEIRALQNFNPKPPSVRHIAASQLDCPYHLHMGWCWNTAVRQAACCWPPASRQLTYVSNTDTVSSHDKLQSLVTLVNVEIVI